MCGFFGVQSVEKKINSVEFNNILERMSHRGPDDSGYFEYKNVQLGFRRLSIIDLDNGRQPMISSDKNFVMVFNGEIYNYKELQQKLRSEGIYTKTNSDSEVLLESFMKWGVDSLNFINGMFAFVIYDLKKNKIYLVRDRFGIKPLYYTLNSKHFIFSSEIKSIINSNLINAEPNYKSISSYLSFRYPYGTGTFFDHINQVDPGEIIELENNKIIKKKYWELPRPNYSKDLGESYYLEKLQDTFNDVIKDHMVSDVPVGGLLSGGLDSSLIVALMSNNCKKNFNTYSASFNEKNYDELKYAKIVSNANNTDHYNINLSYGDYINKMEKIIEHK